MAQNANSVSDNNNLENIKHDIYNRRTQFTWFQRIIINTLKQGPLPKHVAFIMDGNRRYSSEHNLSKTAGYLKGYESLVKIRDILIEVGIKEITVYAFSNENFKRDSEEIKLLFRLFREKLCIANESHQYHDMQGICFRFIGNRHLLSLDMQKLMAQIELGTMHNTKFIFNCAIAYTSRDDITNSMRTILKGVQEKRLKSIDIDENLIEQCLSTSQCTEPDIIVRTSGETRFSDFLLWENTTTMFITIAMNWPDMHFWEIMKVIFNYQIFNGCLKKSRSYLFSYRTKEVSEETRKRQMEFVKSIRDEKFQEIVKMNKY